MVLDCIESWKRFAPDYEIMEWGAPKIAEMGNRFAIEAFENRKWAFASDVLRLHVLNEYGGVYLDSDLLLTAPIDRFLDNRYFMGFEVYHGKVAPGGWLLASEKGDEIVADLLAEYDDIPFVQPDGSFDQMTNTYRISRYFSRRFGVDPPYDKDATVEPVPGVKIYPAHIFCTPEEGKENYSIHLFNGAWMDSYTRKLYRRIGRWEFARFRRQKKGRILPLRDGERLIALIPTRLNGSKKLAVILKPRKK
jgi:hypothetical protein